MDPETSNTNPKEETSPQSNKNEIDLDKILLPKKEIHSPASAQRVNAAALLQAVEAEAAKPEEPPKPIQRLTPTPPKAPEPKPVGPAPQVGSTVQPKTAAPTVLAADGSPVAKTPEGGVKAVTTFKSDVEKLIQNQNVSVLDIAAAEAKRKGQTETPEDAEKRKEAIKTFGLRTLMIAGGLILILSSGGVLTYLLTRPTTVEIPQAPQAPFISVDSTQIVTFDPRSSREQVIQALTAAKQQVRLSLGLVARLWPAVTSENGTLLGVNTQNLLGPIARNMPQELLRALSPTYLLGVHSFEDNQPFLLFKVESYERGYSGMLEWERGMQADLSTLFYYTPRTHIPEEGIVPNAPTSTPTQVISTGFTDRIVENKDTRVIQNAYGDILLLWTFLDRNTILITTNQYTLREVISRLREAPVIPLPQ